MHKTLTSHGPKIKVLHLIDTLQVGGSERSLLEILRQQNQTEPLVCQIYQGDELKPLFEQSGIRIVSLGLKGKYKYTAAIRKVIALIRREKPDIIHATLARANFIGRIAGKWTGLPVICSFVNESYSKGRYKLLKGSLKWKIKTTEFLDRATASLAFHFIANSEAVKNSNCRRLRIREKNVSVIYRGREPAAFERADQNVVQKLRDSLNLPQNTRVILNVARLVPQKAHHDLLLALSVPKIAEFQMLTLIAGEGPCRTDLERLIEQNSLKNKVRLLGQREDVADLLSLADLFVFPSYYEGHPGSLVEAMFAARPIVASDIAIHREILQNHDTGLLMPAENPSALAEAIFWMLQNPEEARQMGKRAQEFALSKFDIHRTAPQQEEVYSHVLEKWRSVAKG